MTAGPGEAAAEEVAAAGPSALRSAAAQGAGSASADFWSQLVAAQTSDQLCNAWLGILCMWVPQTEVGLLLLRQEDERYAPAAVWPDPGRDVSYLGDAAQEALVEQRGVVREEAEGRVQCAYPLVTSDQAFGVVVLHLKSRTEAGLREALRILHWGAGWLVGLLDKRNLQLSDLRLRRSGLLQDLLLGALAEADAADAARWVVNRLAEALPCRMAVLALSKGGQTELVAVSGTAGFEARSNLLAGARQALAEVMRAGLAAHHPPRAGDASVPETDAASQALADYVRHAGVDAAAAVPMLRAGRPIGALLLDWDEPPPQVLRGYVDTLGSALAPCLDLQRTATRSLWSHARASAGQSWHAAVGPRHAGAKFLSGLALLTLAVCGVVQTDFVVHAPATIEGQIVRAAVAPFDGYIADAPARAGDVVRAGDLLARLDDRDLRLEASKAAADAELTERRLREAMARGEAVAVRVAQAEAEQAGAELALVRARLAHTLVTAPLDGLVVKGDLSQQLGAPVEQGRVLFEIAPLDTWRVVMKVDERDIVNVREGQDAELVLAGLPGWHQPLKVVRLSPVAVAEDGRNSFRVEARMADAPAAIQPGMEGVGRIVAGRHSLLWLGFHRLADWAAYTTWTLGL